MDTRRTEYKGVVFDSKSEAVFARTLDIAGHEWIYHPGEHCGHEWDFLLFPTHTYNKYMHMRVGEKRYDSEATVLCPASKPMLIEYKPSMPTNTYVDELTEQMKADPVESVVVWGNPWDGKNPKLPGVNDCCYIVYPIFCSHGKYGWGDFIRLADNGEDVPTSTRHGTWDVLGINDDMAEEAKNYRFDLVDD